MVLAASLVGLLGLAAVAGARVQISAPSLHEEEITFASGGVMLAGTVVFPEGEGRYPAVVLVHGSGPGPREQLRREAEAFARLGVVSLIYDKRTVGYSATGTGARSYDLLADDALAAVAALRGHRAVTPEAVGLWGLSEGGWVAPLAANRGDDVAFVVLVGSSGMPPAQQVAWSVETDMRHHGISGSVVEAFARTAWRVLAGTGGMAEGDHDPIPPLERLRQPVLAIWGELDRTALPAESAEITRAALERGGNQDYTIRFFAAAQHGMEASADGFTRGDALVSGYPELVGTWIHAVARGERAGPSSDPLPPQELRSRPLAPLAWWESEWAQLGVIALPLAAFVSYPLSALVIAAARFVRRGGASHGAAVPVPGHRWASGLVVSGLAAMIGFAAYFAYALIIARSYGPLIGGVPLPWLGLQLLAVAACVLAGLLARSWWTHRAALTAPNRVRQGLLLAGAVVFAIWAGYWSLLRV